MASMTTNSRHRLFLPLLLLSALFSVSPAQSLFQLEENQDAANAAKPLTAVEIMAECTARMPKGTIFLQGALNMRKRYGVSLKKFPFEATARFAGNHSAFRYKLSLSENGAPTVFTATRSEADGLVISRSDGLPPPNPTDSIEGTDISWLDATMDFVWWVNPVIVGTDRIKGRLCDILEVEPPAPLADCKKVRLWIDRSQFVVLQAEQLDPAPVRRMWVRAVQKVDDCWVLKNMEVETIGSGHRTLLQFDSVRFLAPAPEDSAKISNDASR